MTQIEDIIAKAILASDEVSSSNPEPSLEWAERYWRDHHSDGHKGDCDLCAPELQGPITCQRCVCDDALLRASGFLAALKAAGFVVVPLEPTYDMVMDGHQEIEDPSPHNLEAAWLRMLNARPK